MLEQINSCAALPGRPKLEIPAEISREVRRQHCEIPCSATPHSPFDVALNLSFDTPRPVCPEEERPHSFKLSDPLINSPVVQECSSLDSQRQSPVALLNSESQVSSLVSQPSTVQVPDVRKEECDSPENAFNDPEVCNCELKLLNSSPPEKVVTPLACLSKSEEKVRKCSVSAPENPPQLRPVKFVSAAYYVERPPNSQSLSQGNSVRRPSFCRIEAFVVRSKSIRPMPGQNRSEMHELKK